MYKGQLFVFGILNNENKTTFSIYKLNRGLVATDSLQVDVSKNKAGTYLKLSADTLHDLLSVYLHEENKTELNILRFNSKPELISTIKNVPVARLNNSSLFDEDVLYFKDQVYSVKVISDTSGKQFYINAFDLKSKDANYDYTRKWQFPFERKNVEDAHIIYATKKHVFIYVYVSEGLKKGQWLLQLNANKGELVKATKLNDKSETNTYVYGNHMYDSQNKSLILLGQIFTEAQFDHSKKTLNIQDVAQTSIYYLEIDSTGTVQSRQSFKIPIISVVSGAKKVPSAYLLKIKAPKKTADGKLSFEGDIYKSENKSLCYLYVNSTYFMLAPAESGLVLEKNSIATNQLIEDYYSNKDKLDQNGKICLTDISELPKLFYREPGLSVKQNFKRDDANNLCWILCKHTFNKNNVNYSLLSPVNKVYKVSTLEDISETKSPGSLSLSNTEQLIFYQSEESKFQLKIYKW